jgi:hypothetical protein
MIFSVNFVICEQLTNQTFKTTVHEYTRQMETYCEKKKSLDGTFIKVPSHGKKGNKNPEQTSG